MSEFRTAHMCNEDADGCGRIAEMPANGAPNCCPACGSQEILFGVVRFVHDTTRGGECTAPDPSSWKPVRRIQNPAAAHIPMGMNKARRAREMPWSVKGGKILLYMASNEEREKIVRDSAGERVLGPDGKPLTIAIAAVKGHMGEDKERTYGLVVAFGAGEVTPSGGYISPEFDYGVTIGSVAMIEPNSGTPFTDETEVYRAITIWDIVAGLDPKYGLKMYQRLRTRASAALKKYEDDKDEVGFKAAMPAAVPMGIESKEEILEKARTAHGAATKPQFLVQGLKK